MIFEYTPAEAGQMMEIDQRYAAQLDALDNEISKLAPRAKEATKLKKRRIALEDDRLEELTALYEKFEQARFDALGADPAAITADALQLIPAIIEKVYNDRRQYDLVYDPASLLFDPTTGPAGDLAPRYKAAGQDDPKIESGEALTILRRELRRHFDALKDRPEESGKIREFIYTHISASPYIYTDPNRPVDLAALGDDSPRRAPLPVPKAYGFMNDKVNHQFIGQPGTSKEVNGQMQLLWAIEQAPGPGPSVPVYASLRYDGPDLQLSRPMTAFDTAIYNTVSTLWYYHRLKAPDRPLIVTPQELWRITNGERGTKNNPSPKQLQRVRDSLDKMRFTRIFMDVSREIEAKRIILDDKRVVKGTIDTYLLKSDRVSFTTEKGNTVEGYRIESEPILYTYNRAKDHFLWVDFGLLDTSTTTGNEGHTVEFRQYLLQQIKHMTDGARDSYRILYETVYKKTAITPPENRFDPGQYSSPETYQAKVRQEAKKDREKISAILDAWAQKGYIKGYTHIKSGRTYVGIDIVL